MIQRDKETELVFQNFRNNKKNILSFSEHTWPVMYRETLGNNIREKKNAFKFNTRESFTG